MMTLVTVTSDRHFVEDPPWAEPRELLYSIDWGPDSD